MIFKLCLFNIIKSLILKALGRMLYRFYSKKYGVDSEKQVSQSDLVLHKNRDRRIGIPANTDCKAGTVVLMECPTL